MDEEIIQLRALKEHLLKKIVYLEDRLKDQEENGRKESINFNTTLFPDDDDHKLSESLSAKYEAKLCDITAQVTGITFDNVDRKLLRNDIYIYTAKVITKTISFDIELTVILKYLNDDFKIENITCYFNKNIHDCYILEISPWFKKITNMKNFSLLMSALSDYNAKNIFRSKILHSLEIQKYASSEQCTQENGGILVYVHSSVDTEKSYVIFQWTMKFLDLTWQIEHFFTVKSTDIGMEFSEENRSLLKEFCEFGLTENSLVELWEKLCIAIDNYAGKST
ncbi:hypothetical protein ALC56_13107 [Trachymyrmex septentrionalis]|uniref:Centromere protein P n=1 Tax=Trachymyrmex septentrionalis TaxID=34720 RepID=A0A195EWH1_9HYME|nr:PREDICTED: uncharacterized protein LOC108754283 [Trachymyrmex septentrionalis]KYN32625.1 hypothetical protein ALC56_13107 [Trachymyrmex septentrionalis]